MATHYLYYFAGFLMRFLAILASQQHIDYRKQQRQRQPTSWRNADVTYAVPIFTLCVFEPTGKNELHVDNYKSDLPALLVLHYLSVNQNQMVTIISSSQKRSTHTAPANHCRTGYACATLKTWDGKSSCRIFVEGMEHPSIHPFIHTQPLHRFKGQFFCVHASYHFCPST